jgi:hypothetical protein
MSEKRLRKELLDSYKRTHPEAGVYCIRNNRNGKALLGSTPNLGSIRGKLDFARATGSASVLNQRLHKDAAVFGLDAFALEIQEVLEITPEMTQARIRDDLAALEALWREQFDPLVLY